MHFRPSRLIAIVLALLSACSKGASRPAAPFAELHYPAWLGTMTDSQNAFPLLDDKLFVVNLDQDLEFNDGSLLTISIDPAAMGAVPGTPDLPDTGLAVPSMAGKLMIVDADAAQKASNGTTPCQTGTEFQPPFALLPGHTTESLDKLTLNTTVSSGVGSFSMAAQKKELIDLSASNASSPFGVGLTCSPDDGHPRAWVSYERGANGAGYVAQVDLASSPATSTLVFTGNGYAREFAYDTDHDRLYVTSQEFGGKAPIRWITVGNGCKVFDGGVQDERQGGCHVDSGFDISSDLAGAEPNEVALSSAKFPCTATQYAGQTCRRMYLSVRVFDIDLYRALGERPPTDVGGELVVLELPESNEGGPDPQWVRGLEIGVTAGQLLVIPRPAQGGNPQPDLIAVLAVDDELLWIYDDAVGAMVKVFGRDPNTGVPLLGHFPSGLASRPSPNSNDANPVVRIFVSSYHDSWVSAVDVPLNDPASATLVTDSNGNTLHLGVVP